MTEETKQRIIEFLKKGESSLSKISMSLGINFYKTEETLAELKKEKLVEVVEKSRGNYWKLKDLMGHEHHESEKPKKKEEMVLLKIGEVKK